MKGKSTDIAKRMRMLALEMAFNSGKNGTHLGGGLSAIEIFAVLYNDILNVNPQDPYNENRDRLIVSKGHCVLAYYTALFETGFLSEEDLRNFEVNGYNWHGHATRNLKKGIEFSGGSLSMGMSFAVGEAFACKKKGLHNRVYVIVGDGECDEGLIWESLMAAAHFELNNLVVIVDKNGLQYDGETIQIMNQISLADKFRSFGFDTIEVDGHNCKELYKALTADSTKPRCVIANTIKGKGVSFMENQKQWHHSTLNSQQYEQAMKEVENG